MKSNWHGLNFPVFDDSQEKPKRISMEAYAKFVQFGWEHAAKRDEQLERRLKTRPTKRFSLSDPPG